MTPTNEPPTLNAIGDVELFESLTDVLTVTATDPDGDNLSFSLGGDDATSFQLSSEDCCRSLILQTTKLPRMATRITFM